MLTGIIFDMDGVIIDSEATHKDIEIRLVREHGLDIDREEYIQFTGRPLREIIEILNAEYDAGIDLHTFIEERKRRYRDRMDEVEIIDGQDALIRDLTREYPVAVATSEERDIAETVLREKELEPFIDALVTASDIQNGKPDPEIFEDAAAALGTEPATTAVIEDSPNGVGAANAGGFISIGFQSSDELDLSAADHVVEDSTELRQLLEELGDAA